MVQPEAMNTDQGVAKAAGWTSMKQQELTKTEFEKFSTLIYDLCGIKLPVIKKTMLSARLNKRMRMLGFTSFAEYFQYVNSARGQQEEIVHMIDAVSTNKTDFFREPYHFDFLVDNVLPEFAEKMQRGRGRQLRVWSAGCSRGDEPYTLAMVIHEFFSKYKWMSYSILGTDISTRMLDSAKRAIYPDDVVAAVPAPYRQKYFMKGKGEQKGKQRVVPELRAKVEFRRLNFMDDDFGLAHKMDIIFCRNVIIYFDRQTQVELMAKFTKQFNSGGYLFTGHSESLEGMLDKMQKVGTSVYRCL